MVYAQSNICPGEWDFEIQTDHLISVSKYLNFAKELKKLWNMRVMIIPIVIDTLGTVTQELLKGLKDLEIRGQVETNQTTTLLRSARILRRVLETWGDLLLLKLQWKTII